MDHNFLTKIGTHNSILIYVNKWEEYNTFPYTRMPPNKWRRTNGDRKITTGSHNNDFFN